MKLFLSRYKKIDFYLFIGVIVIAIILTSLYISHEQYIYFWDYTHYSDRVAELATKLQRSPFKAIECFVDYLGDDYTQIPSLPLLPFALLFGNSRLVFILSLVLTYVVSFCLIMGKVATKIIDNNTRLVFWTTAYLTLFIPATWLSILRGYPDLGGASLITLAILFYWKHPQLNQRKHIIQLAGLLAIAVWFRRPFAYSVRAFVVTLLIETLINYISYQRQAPKLVLSELKKSLLKVLKISLWFIIFSPVLVFKVLFVDYNALYASYELTAYEGLKYYTSEFGWLTCALAVLGYSFGFLIQKSYLQRYRFFWILGGLTIAQWILLAKQNGSHYTTHFIPFVVVGLTLLIFSLKKFFRLNSKRWIILLGLGWCLASFNMTSGLTTIGERSHAISVLFPRSQPPLYRADYDKFTQLVRFLRNNVLKDQYIYVAASSETLTSDALLAGDRQMFQQTRLNVLRTSNIDSRDVYPLNALMKAAWVVVASPVQYHLMPTEQNVVKVVVDAFQQNWLFAKDFELMSTEFTLEKGVRVKLYRRIRATPLPTVLTTLQQMRANIDRQPGREPFWLTLQSEQPSTIEKDIIQTVQIRDILLQQQHPSSFLYFGSLSPSLSLQAKLNAAHCQNSGVGSLQVAALDAQGNVLTAQSWRKTQGDDIRLVFKGLPGTASYLRLDVERLNGIPDEQTDNECSISVNNVVVQKSS